MPRQTLFTKWIAGLGVAAVAASASAQQVEPAGFRRVGPTVPCPVPCPIVPCPAPLPPGAAPTAPAQPGAQPGTSPTSPLDTSPLNAPSPTPPGGGGGLPGLGGAPSAGTGATASLAPNMMGDQFGGRSLTFQGAALPTVAIFQAIPPGGLAAPDEPLLAASTRGNFVVVNPNVGIIDIQGIGQRLPNQLYGPIEPFRQSTPGPTFTPPPGDRINQIFAAISQPGGGLFELVKGNVPGLTRVTVDPVTGQLLPNQQVQYSTIVRGDVSAIPIEVPSPGAGGTVGRVKLSEDNNPLPRDRFIFIYDHFGNTPLISQGVNVDRFQFGVEKTIFNGRASVEFRIPFAGTLASNATTGVGATATELGDLRFALKVLVWRSQFVNISMGSGVSLPTANDLVANLPGANGQSINLLRLKNESVVVEPFIGILLTPNDRVFAQVWSTVSGDVSGSPLTVNPALIKSVSAVKFYDRIILAVDGQLGYWLYRSNASRLRGLAPFIELHWNHGFDVADPLTFGTGQGVAVGGSIGNDELNLTSGVTAQLYNNMLVTVGASAPLLNRPDRSFDAQFGVRVNWFFGRTARQRNAAYLANTF